MGYTHYWTYSNTTAYQDVWPQLVADAARIIQAVTDTGIELAGPLGDGRPRAELGGIRLNGVQARGQSYETFLVWPPTSIPDDDADDDADVDHPKTLEDPAGGGLRSRRGWTWDFCKTDRQPYDLAVTAILLRCHLLLPQEFLIASDGTWDREWNQPVPATDSRHGISPRQLIASVFGPIPQDDQLTPASQLHTA